MGKYRMYEPYGYAENNDYVGKVTQLDNELAANRENDKKEFASVEYNETLKAFVFKNVDGEQVGYAYMNDIVPQDLIEDAKYDVETKSIVVTFTNGQVVTIPLDDIIDVAEAGDGLQLIDNKISIKLDETTEEFLTVSANGLKVNGVQTAIDVEKDRAIDAEETLDSKIGSEISRAQTAENDIVAALRQEVNSRITDVDSEEERAIQAENNLDAKISQEIVDREADVETEKARAEAEELRIDNTLGAGFSTAATETVAYKINTLNDNLTLETSNRTTQDNQLQNNINNEVVARQGEITRIENLISQETTRATNSENTISTNLSAEITRAKGVENDIKVQLTAHVNDDTVHVTSNDKTVWSSKVGASDIADFFDDVEYLTSEQKIAFKHGNTIKAELDATPFIKDGMVKDVKVENGKLIIEFNTDSGAETIEIPLTDIFNPSDYYTKDEINASLALKADKNEIPTKVSELENDANYLTEHQDLSEYAKIADVDTELAKKADTATTYTQEEVNELIAVKDEQIKSANTDLYNLKKIVGDMGGNVTYDLPNALGTSFNSLMNNNGTVKLADDVTSGRFGPGILASNHVKLNLNSHNLTISGLTVSSSTPGILARGTQEITVGGNGIIDTNEGICIQTSSENSVVNLTGSTTTYQTNRPNGELIYCYQGTINISNGTFKNNGSKYLLNCYDANYRNGTAKIIVTGGKFYDFDPSNNTAEGENTSFLAEGYHTEASTVIEDGVEHTVYTVKKNS